MVVVKISPMLGSTNQKIGFANNLNDLFKEKISKNKQAFQLWCDRIKH